MKPIDYGTLVYTTLELQTARDIAEGFDYPVRRSELRRERHRPDPVPDWLGKFPAWRQSKQHAAIVKWVA